MHKKVKCGECHKRKTGIGRTSFVGLSPSCANCHKDPHDFTSDKFRTNCKMCHVVGGVAPKSMRGADVPFDHEGDTGIALVGRHGKARCVDCHKKGKFAMTENRRTCRGCHKNPHGTTYAKWTCSDCHHPSRPYRRVTFNHRATQFELSGKHTRVTCKQCHKKKNVKPPTTCNSCHRDQHRGRFDKRDCTQCHPNGSWKPSAFDHGKRTSFALTGKHTKLGCRSCHRGSKKKGTFERHETAVCQDCHAHENAHNGQFGKRPCLDCHKEGGSKKLKFDHNKDARFALTGFHAELDGPRGCKKCHQKGNYRTGKIRCVDCHADPHSKELGVKCERCHDTGVKFPDVKIDHDKQTSFRIVGLHEPLACSKCHPAKGVLPRYKLAKKACVDCHEKDDPHVGKLGRRCARCHRVEKKAPKFSHGDMTAFALTGTHQTVACSFCHRPRPAGGPPPVKWTIGLARKAVDKKFPVMGTKCADCHADQHDGRYGSACQSCHQTQSFGAVNATVHDTGAFRLEGVHDRLPCERCHQSKRLLGGLGEMCQTCHWDDDGHNNALGPYCGDCHLQIDWRPTKFTHVQTAFPLRGAHVNAPCAGCHGVGTYQGTPTECETCHTRDAAAVTDPVHTGELTPCERCHTVNGFIPVRLDHQAFPLIGRHVFVRCRNCHAGGSYAGTPNTCETCHLTQYYDPRVEPNHQAEGYSTTCSDCHTPAGWRPATGG